MNKLFSKKLWTALAVVCASLLVAVVVVTDLANRYAPLLNSTFKLETYRLVDDGDGTENTEYFTVEHKTADAVKSFAEQVCEEVEAEGLVLLENKDGALPMEKEAKVSLFLTGSVEINASAQGVRNTEDKTKYPTFKKALEDVNVSVNPSLWDLYVKATSAGYANGSKPGGGYGGYRKLNAETNLQTGYINEMPYDSITNDVKGTFAEYGDAAIAVITRDSTEGSDAVTHGSDGANGDYLTLSNEERGVLEQISSLRASGVFKRIVIIINSALPVQLDFMLDENITVDACLWIGNTGMSGINAVAKALVGDVVPSGKLTDTFVYDNYSSPAMANWVLSENAAFANSWDASRFNDSNRVTTQRYYGVYVEGIYVGYRYYETRYTDVVEGAFNVGEYDYSTTVAYPFGYGLSYTDFTYGEIAVEEKNDEYEISVPVTNSGSVDGKETVEIYLQKPYTDYARKNGIEVAAVELVGFGKTPVIKAGETETVVVTVPKSELTSYDVYGAGTYILDAGDYYFTAAKDAHAAANNILTAKQFTTDDGMVGEGKAALTEKITVAERDITTYAVSEQTGNDIGNKLADGDINRFSGGGDNVVTYVSRSDWDGTFPKEAVTLKLTDAMIAALENVDINDVKSEGDSVTFGANGEITLVMMRGKDYNDPDWDKILDTLSFDEMNTLLTTCISQTPVVASIVKPQTKEMDGPTYCKEGITDSRFPCEGIWSATFNLELIAKVGQALAEDAVLAGYSGMWIPGINIHRTPYGGRTHEYFSEDPFLTGVAAEAEIISLQKYGIIAQPKHYAFNEQEIDRGGIGIWVNEQTAREIYIEPWKYAVSPERGNAHALMSAFNRFGCKWVSADKNLIDGILRDEFGFEGYIITDMADAVGVQYMTALDGILAGTDCWLSSGSHSFETYKNNITVTNAMREAAKRILYNVCNYSIAMNGCSTTTRIVHISTWWEITLTSMIVLFSVLTAGSMAMGVWSYYRGRKNK